MARKNYDKLMQGEIVNPNPKALTSLRQVTSAVYTREEAGVDCADPWLASCEVHNEMLSCPTKSSALAACKNKEWCSGCRIDNQPRKG